MVLNLKTQEMSILRGFIRENICKSTGVEKKVLENILISLDMVDSNKELLNNFIDKYSYGGESVQIEGSIANIDLLINGYEYCAKWSIEDMSKINLNDFIVDYVAVLNAKESIPSNVYKGEEVYKERYKQLQKDLNEIGIIANRLSEEEGYVLMTYELPVDRLKDDDYIYKFDGILEGYKSFFKEEMGYIYG